MKKSKLVFAISAVAGAALMIPAVHADNDQRRTQERATDQRPADKTSGDRDAGQVISDQVLETQVKAALIGNDETKARNIEVEVRNGVVSLHGTVDSTAEAERAEREAKSVDGVREVRNSLTQHPKL